MSVYFLFIAFTFAYGLLYSKVKENKLFFDFLYVLCATSIFGFRYQVGVDWFNYIRVYERSVAGAFNFDTMEIGYKWLNILSSYTGFNYLGVIFASTVLFFIFTIYGLKKSRINPYYFIAITAPYHLVMSGMNYTRQSIALSIMILAFSYILNNERKKFIFWVLISSTFHTSAILFLTLLLYKVKVRIQAIFLITLTPILYFISIERYHEYFETNLSSSGLFLRLIYIITGLFILLITNSYENIKTTKDSDINRVCFLSIPLMLFISIISSTMADRISYYFIVLITMIIMRQLEFCRKTTTGVVYGLLFSTSLIVFIFWIYNSKYIPAYIFKSSIELF